MVDFDDCQRMRALFADFTVHTLAKNKAVEAWTNAEKALCLSIARLDISDKLAWKKQCIEVIKIAPDMSVVFEIYCDNKAAEKVYTNLLKAIENETNVLKKIHEHTPN